MITVLIADDHAMVREGLRALLSSMEGYELVGTASTGADAIREAILLKPDLLILDIGFPDLSGIEGGAQPRQGGALSQDLDADHVRR